MVWDTRRRRSIFDLFDDIIDEMEETMKAIAKELERISQEGAENVRPYYYGVRITIGPDGVPRIEEFGNIRRGKIGKPVITDEIEPLVDVMEDEDEVWVIAELPGVEKDKIKVKVSEDYVEIRAENGKKYYKKVELPVKVDPKSAKAKYKNGVLDIRIKKLKTSGEKEVEVQVE